MNRRPADVDQARIVLVGPPAAGKSTISSSVAELVADTALFSLDPAVIELAAMTATPLRVSDEMIEHAVELTVRRYDECDKPLVVLELPHHDYPLLVADYHEHFAKADLVCVVRASYDTVKGRNAGRAHPVPDAYVARSAASTGDLPAILDRHGIAWTQIDTDTCTADVAAQLILDLARRSRSSNLRLLDLLVDPLRPSIGGHLRDDGEWSDGAVATLIPERRPFTLLDVGAGSGFALERFLDLGIDAWGVEPSPRALTNMKVAHRILEVDFNERWLDIPRSFDLVWCVEVLEHLGDRALENAVRTLAAAAASTVLVSAAAEGQPGYHHVNCRHSDAWIALFARHGLVHLPILSSAVRKAAEPDIGPFGRADIAENALVFAWRDR